MKVIPFLILLIFGLNSDFEKSFENSSDKNSLNFECVEFFNDSEEKVFQGKTQVKSEQRILSCDYGYCSCMYVECENDTGDINGCWMIFELCMCGAYGDCLVDS